MLRYYKVFLFFFKWYFIDCFSIIYRNISGFLYITLMIFTKFNVNYAQFTIYLLRSIYQYIKFRHSYF